MNAREWDVILFPRTFSANENWPEFKFKSGKAFPAAFPHAPILSCSARNPPPSNPNLIPSPPTAYSAAWSSMASNMNLDELIARPLDAIARLGVELEAQQQPASENTATTGGHKEEGALLAAAISTALRSGDSPALNKVPILCRDSLAEVCVFARFIAHQHSQADWRRCRKHTTSIICAGT